MLKPKDLDSCQGVFGIIDLGWLGGEIQNHERIRDSYPCETEEYSTYRGIVVALEDVRDNCQKVNSGAEIKKILKINNLL